MKTIEQRAQLNLEYERDFLGNDLSENMVRRAYIKGCYEQKAIDEKVRLKKSDDMTEAEYDRETAFAGWYLKNGKGTPTYSDAIEWSRKEMLDEVCNWFKTNVKWMSNQLMSILMYELRKAMEE